MSEPRPARPPQVTLAAWLVIGGSVVVVLMAFSQVAGLRSLETREAVEEYLSKPPGDALGIGVQGALSVMRVALMVAAACATATAILGWHVLQRSRGSRIALTLLAAPLFVTGLAGGGIASAVVTAAIVMLWFQPARDWFDGITRPAAAVRSNPAPPSPASSHPAPPVPGRDPLLDLPPPTAPPLYAAPYAVGAAARSRRPGSVTWACVLAGLFSLVVFAVFAVTLVLILGDPSALLDELHKQNPDLAGQGLTDATMKTVIYATCAVAMAWSAISATLSLLAWRRVRWAATTLVVSAGLAAGMCLLTVVGSLAMLVPLAACVATVVLLLRPESRRWFARSA